MHFTFQPDIPRMNWLHKLNWESKSQRATTSRAFIFSVDTSTQACITTVKFRSSEYGGGVNVGNYSTERLILTRPFGCVLAHSWCLMPHLSSEPMQHCTLTQWHSTVLKLSLHSLQKQIMQDNLTFGSYTFIYTVMCLCLKSRVNKKSISWSLNVLFSI